jgi:hypothetical protein
MSKAAGAIFSLMLPRIALRTTPSDAIPGPNATIIIMNTKIAKISRTHRNLPHALLFSTWSSSDNGFLSCSIPLKSILPPLKMDAILKNGK